MLDQLQGLLSSYKLEHLDLHYEVNLIEFPNLEDSRYDLRSVLVLQNGYPNYKKRELFRIKRHKIVSILDEKVNRELFERNNQLNKFWDEKVLAKGIVYGHKDYYKYIDQEVEKTRASIRKKLYQPTLNEFVYDILLGKDSSLEQKTERYILKQVKAYLSIESNLQKTIKSITKSRMQTQYERIFTNQVSPELNSLIGEGFFSWSQIFLIIDHQEKIIKYFTGSAKGTAARQAFSVGAYLFSTYKEQKTIKTDCLFFYPEGQVEYFTEELFVLYSGIISDVPGLVNSEKIKQVTGSVRKVKGQDLDFDYFIATGKRLSWIEEK